MFIHAWDLSKEPSKASGVPRWSSVGFAVVMVGVGGGGGGGGGMKTYRAGWVGRDGGVGVQGRARAAESWCERSRELSRLSAFGMGTSGSRKSSSVGGEGLDKESWGSVRPCKPQRESVGGRWEMVESYGGGSLNQGDNASLLLQ